MAKLFGHACRRYGRRRPPCLHFVMCKKTIVRFLSTALFHYATGEITIVSAGGLLTDTTSINELSGENTILLCALQEEPRLDK